VTVARRAVAVLALAVAFTAPVGRLNAQSDQVIHVGVSSFEANAGAYYAVDNGFFKDEGLDVEVQPFNGGGAIVSAVAGGSLQVGAANPLPIAIARQRGGLDFVIIAPGSLYDQTVNPPNLVVAPNSPIRSGKDFDGTTVAVTSLSGTDPLCALSWIDATGGDSHRVKLTELPQSLMGDAVFNGRVSSATLADPANTAAFDAGKVRRLATCYGAFGKFFFVSSWFAKSEWANRNPDLARRFRAAIDRAGVWATRNPVAAAAILRKYMSITEARAHEVHAKSIDPAMIQPILDLALRYKFLDRKMDARELIWSPPAHS
jgi:NitT/TauT family transport system substrate-binding protein